MDLSRACCWGRRSKQGFKEGLNMRTVGCSMWFFFFSQIGFFWRERRWKHVRYLVATAVVPLSFFTVSEESAKPGVREAHKENLHKL